MTRFLLAFLLLLAPIARASCTATPMYVADVAVQSCQTIDAFAASRDSCDLAWIADMRRRMTERNRGGVVLTGFVTAKLEITWWDGKSATFGARSVVNEPGTWFVDARAKLSCETAKPGDTVQLFLATPCCDVFPPMDVACWYGIGRLDALHEPIARAMGSAGP